MKTTIQKFSVDKTGKPNYNMPEFERNKPGVAFLMPAFDSGKKYNTKGEMNHEEDPCHRTGRRHGPVDDVLRLC
jgi:hypothetical protein